MAISGEGLMEWLGLIRQNEKWSPSPLTELGFALRLLSKNLKIIPSGATTPFEWSDVMDGWIAAKGCGIMNAK
jgi:hypothetical protein